MAPKLRIDFLPPAQGRFWRERSRIPSHFVLYGGTAIALRLGHRISEDFDFFSAQEFDRQQLLAELNFAESEVLQSSENTLTLRVDRAGPIKLSFFGGLTMGQIATPAQVEAQDFSIASLEDLFATKLKVVWQRAEAKDYIDIAAIIDAGISLEHGLGCARAVYGDTFNPALALKALTYFEDGDVKTLPIKTRTLLVEAAKAVQVLAEVRCAAPRIGKH